MVLESEKVRQDFEPRIKSHRETITRLQQKRTEMSGRSMSPSEAQDYRHYARLIAAKQTSISNLERRYSARMHLATSHEAGVFGVGRHTQAARAKEATYYYSPKTGRTAYWVAGGTRKDPYAGKKEWQDIGSERPTGYVGGRKVGVASEAFKEQEQLRGKTMVQEIAAIRRGEPTAQQQIPTILYGPRISLAEGITKSQKRVTGIVTAAPKPSFLKETPGYFKGLGQRFEYKALKVPGAKGQLYQAGAFGLGVAAGFTYPIRHPVSFAKGVYTLGKGLVTKPFVTGAAIKQELMFRPAGFMGELAGTAAFGKALPKVAKPVVAKLPKPKITTFKVPTKTGTETLYKGLSIELGARGKPLVGIAKGKIKFGIPTVELAKAKSPFVVETPAQTAIFQKSLAKSAKIPEVTKFKGLLEITRATEKTPSRFVQKSFIKETKALSPKGVGEVLKFAKKEKAEVYGSFAARQQMPKDLSRVSADIDVQLKTGADVSALKTKQLVAKLQKIGEPVRISKKTPTLIETKVGKEWHHAVDIHAFEQAMSEGSPAIAGEKVYGLQLGQKPIKIKGIETMRLSEQGVRKMGSIATARPGKKITLAPETHRIKDIGDWFTTQETLLKSKFLPQPVRLAKLQKLKTLYPAEIFKKATPTKIQLYSPPKVVSPKLPSVAFYPSFPIKRLKGGVPVSPVVSPARAAKYPSAKVSPRGRLASLSASAYVKPSPSKPISAYKYPYKPSPKKGYISPLSPKKPSPYKPSPPPSPYKVPSPKKYDYKYKADYYKKDYYKDAYKDQYYKKDYYKDYKKTFTKKDFFYYRPKIKQGIFIEKKGKKRKPHKFKYSPSLIAGFKKITAPKIPKTITGLGVRPVVRGL